MVIISHHAVQYHYHTITYNSPIYHYPHSCNHYSVTKMNCIHHIPYPRTGPSPVLPHLAAQDLGAHHEEGAVSASHHTTCS